MRWTILTFYLASLGLFAGEPSEAILGLFTRVLSSAETVDIREELALSAFCGPEKKKLIEKRWGERIAWLRSSEIELSPWLEKVDGNLAAVLLSARSETEPDAVSVLALGVVKVAGQWQAAPIEGSFDNAGLGFAAEMRERVRALEQWMVSQKIAGVAQLQASERARFRESLQALVSPEKLKLEEPEEVLKEFLKCAQAGEAEALQVWQGLLERDQLPERDWERVIKATRLGMKGDDPRSAWRVLKSNQVMRVIIEGRSDGKEASYLVAFLSSFRVQPRDDCLNAIRFEMLKTEEGWRVTLPPFLTHDHEEAETHRDFFNQSFDWNDYNSAMRLGDIFEIENAALRANHPKDVLAGVLGDLKENQIDPFLRRFYREKEEFEKEEAEDEEEDEDEEEAAEREALDAEKVEERRLSRYHKALDWWARGRLEKESSEVSLWQVFQEGELALGVFRAGLDKSGWKPELFKIWLVKQEDGWAILPGIEAPLAHSVAPSMAQSLEKLTERFALEEGLFEKKWVGEILAKFGQDDPAGSVITEEAGQKLIKEWQQVAREGSFADLLTKSAFHKRPDDPDKFLRNLSYLRATAVSALGAPRVLGSMSAGRFRAFSILMQTKQGPEPLFPIVIIAPTKEGHAILTDLEFPLETNKGLRIMNDARIKTLTAELPEKDLASIIALRAWHQKIARPAWNQWNLDQASKEK